MAAQTAAAEGTTEFQASRLGPCLSPPEPEMQRGRRRARSPMHLSMVNGPSAQQAPSRESSTLRGRCRHRSTSLLGGIASRNPSTASAALPSERSSSRAPTQRQLLHVPRAPPPPPPPQPLMHHHRRHRSQCPSRSGSRSTDGSDGTPHRRRQRTRSRARVHRLEGSFGALDLAPSPLHFQMVVLAADQPSDTTSGNSGSD
ncbi:hypothetical protein GGTG_02940 [Gaeumannomyces tritici R3-111a-1]|uniref:Uncharacterized protein n=1 Tax=Gaeumannomyces tritici (strain R3-111a-1) TaxID=644352 RepID=J3NNT4_GAET3|nr:hypothetical protein GGTG_02940 [Gaeumannomyces tritici R3-111a-1]EJT77837.1 hypothetical protein GGTG_02940 [Gaeumannomyces tritici R3-111a-1]